MSEAVPEYESMLCELGRERESVIVLDAGLATSMKTHLFAQNFPERYFNLGIAEQNAVGVASGLARRGFIPLVHTFSNFIARRAHDQVALSVAWPRCNVKMIGGSCGLFDGRNGPSHMAIDDLTVMFSLPGIMVAEPGDRRQTRELLRKLVSHQGPAYLRLRRHGAPADLLPRLSSDQGIVFARRSDYPLCTLLAAGSMLAEALAAFENLANANLAIDLLHVSVLKPLNEAPIISSAERSGLIVTLENHLPTGGLSDAVARVAGPRGWRHVRLSLPADFIPAGDPEWQLAYCGLDQKSIVERIRSLIEN